MFKKILDESELKWYEEKQLENKLRNWQREKFYNKSTGFPEKIRIELKKLFKK